MRTLKLGNNPNEIAPNEFHEYLVKLVNFRSKTIELRVGKCTQDVIKAHRVLMINLQTYPKRRAEIAAKFFYMNLNMIEVLMPGRSSKAFESFKTKYEYLKNKALCIISKDAVSGGTA